MFDIDYFKKYNDSYGHQEGDIALKAVSTIISTHTNRSYDHAFRVGGEEFLILTYQDNLELLNAFVNTFIKDIEALKISHKDSDVSKYVTVSAGAVQFGDENLFSPDEMYKKVDDLLYEAKSSGRNRLKSNYLN